MIINLDDPTSAQGLGDYTAEARRARSKEFLTERYSELCELCDSAVNIPHSKPGKTPFIEPINRSISERQRKFLLFMTFRCVIGVTGAYPDQLSESPRFFFHVKAELLHRRPIINRK